MVEMIVFLTLEHNPRKMGDAFHRIGNNCYKFKPLVLLECHGTNIVHNYDYTCNSGRRRENGLIERAGIH